MLEEKHVKGNGKDFKDFLCSGGWQQAINYVQRNNNR